MPGFHVGLVFVSDAMRVEMNQIAEGSDDTVREDVPEVLGNDVGGDEVDLAVERMRDVTGLRRASGLGKMTAIDAAHDAHGGFDQDAQSASVVLDHEVVRSGVSPGLGDHDALLGGASHEEKLDPFAASFAVTDWLGGMKRYNR